MKQLLFLATLFLLGCGNQASKELMEPNPETGYPYQLDLLTESGETVPSQKVLKGEPTVVLFWLTTCRPCRKEIKAIAAQYEKWQAELDFNLVLVSRDFEDNRPKVWKLKEEGNWPFTTYIDKNRAFDSVMPGALNGLPQLFLFDKEGNIIYNTRRYRTGDEEQLYLELKKVAS